MTSAIILLVAVLTLSIFLALPLGHYMYRVVEGRADGGSLEMLRIQRQCALCLKNNIHK